MDLVDGKENGSAIIDRSTYLYMDLCKIASTMKIQLRYKQSPELRETFKIFRYCMHELFFLTEDNKDFSEKMKSEFGEWEIKHVSTKNEYIYYSDSIKVFQHLKAHLIKLKLING